MTFILLSADHVDALHDMALNPGELSGRAVDKSLEGALALVDNRLAYGLIGDIFDLAATYATTIATGHCFNDGNKRTAYRTMIICLHLNEAAISHDTKDVGDLIIRVAQGLVHEDGLAEWLRGKAGG